MSFQTERKTGGRRSVRVLALLAAVMLVSPGCSLSGKSGEVTADFKPSAVKTETIAKRTISTPIQQIAEAVAGTVIDVVPKASGQVVNVLKKKGDYVQEGETLFVIDSQDAASSKRKSELSLKNAEESLNQAKLDKVYNRKDLADTITKAETAYRNTQESYNKLRNDYDAGLATQDQVDQAKDATDSARMNLESAQNKLSKFDNTDPIANYETQAENARIAVQDTARSLENYSIKAPGSGVLTDFNIVSGQTVSAAAGKIGQIQQIDPLKIKTELTETNQKLVKDKTELVFFDPGAPEQKYTAPISYLAQIMSATSKTFTLELQVPNTEHKLLPGKRFMVQLTTETEEQVVAVPTLSIVREESNAFVFIKQGDRYQKRQIKLGRVSGEYQEVLEGLKEGEELVVTGQNTMKDGQKVETAPNAQPAGESK